MKFDKIYSFFLITVGVIVVDQIVKMLVYIYMPLGDAGQIPVLGDWFKLYFTTNPGMAFGAKIPGEYGKVILSSIRVIAMFGIGWYMIKLFKEKAHPGFIACVALILGGAVGNLVDSIFYGFLEEGLIVNNAPFTLFHGKVIDMFYFDIAKGYFPSSWPIVGGDYYAFWPIFNIADASIFVAVCIILIYQKQFFAKEEAEEIQKEEVN